MNGNCDEPADWIVLSCSLDTLAILARQDPAVVDDLGRQLRRHEQSSHTSVANRARKLRPVFGPGTTAPPERNPKGDRDDQPPR